MRSGTSRALAVLLRLGLAILGLFLGVFLYIWNLLGRPAYTDIRIVEQFIVPTGEEANIFDPMLPDEITGPGGRVRVWAPPEYPIEKVPQIDNEVTNILVFGVDARSEGETSSRSDAMMVLSLDRRNDVIKITSLMRDLEVDIPGREGQQTKLNAAYSYGGVGLMINTINRNFNLDIQRFMMFDFWSSAGLIDQVGGISVPVTEAELTHLNVGVRHYNELSGRPAEQDVIPSAGNQVLNGVQATAWARIRYIGTDHARTGRQRYIVSEMLAKFAAMNMVDKISTVTEALGHFETNLTRADLTSLALRNLDTLGATSEYKVPADGMYWTNESNWNMIMDRDKQLPALRQFIYGR
ncbi:MAG: LCP family protein [Bacillota bacterium]|nr:LCP family protein [Bacillota bacterium]